MAAALRAIRAIKGLAQNDLASAADRKFLYKIEQSKTDVTIGKLEEIAQAAGMELNTLMVLATIAASGRPAAEVIQDIASELAWFEGQGGLEELALQVTAGSVEARAHDRLKRREAVQSCKAAGLTQRQTATQLQLAKSTVADLWND
ncbi:XRE family transcriptional regulator [Pseudomonas sp. B35(2017)]|uniref:XRE family transcriptional regulator n=1 Tax=Pseudomonas sp. B35(2017) TaxID=1981722 RepID=UPI002113C127|nr:XRE family transcriptional regulator [Pseudomonas sp. B35(2017)]